MNFFTTAWEWLHSHALSLPHLAKFALGMAVIVGIPPLCRRARLPAVVGLLLSGVLLGPYVLGFFGERTPVADFFAELGKLLLMFFAGLDLRLILRSFGEHETNRSYSVSSPPRFHCC